MNHQYNRAAFQIGVNSANLLLALYCSLVDLELALKVHLWPSGWLRDHRLIDWLNNLGEPALAAQLERRLNRLRCTNKVGQEARVDPNNYPNIRYLRHETDFAGKTSDAQLKEALDLVSDVKLALRAKRINI